MLLVVSKVPFFWAKVHFIIVSLTITCTPSHCVTLQRKKCWPFVMSERGLKPLPGLDSQTGVCSAVFLSPSKQLEGPMAVECLWEVVNRRLNRLLCVVFFMCFSHYRLLVYWQTEYKVSTCVSRRSGALHRAVDRIQGLLWGHRVCTQYSHITLPPPACMHTNKNIYILRTVFPPVNFLELSCVC